MTICRVFERPDGSVAVVYPNPAGRRPRETEGAWLARAFARTVEANPDFNGLPYHDSESTALPARMAPCADGCGEEHPVRSAWRCAGSGAFRRVVIDAARARQAHAEIHAQDVGSP